MKLSELKPCCGSPAIRVQETRIESGSPLVAPLWLCRVICDGCGKKSPWGDSLNKAYEWWNKEGDYKMNNKSWLNIRTICFDCAKAHGFVMKDKAVGVWTDRCEVCHEMKPCTNLWHDWRKKGKSK